MLDAKCEAVNDCRSKLYAFIVWQIVGVLQATHEITSSRRSGISHVVTRIHPSKVPKVDHDSAIGLVLDDVTATGARDELETNERSFETHESIQIHRQLIEGLPVG